MTPEEREHSTTAGLPGAALALRHEPDELRKADAIEVVVGQGAKPGGGGMLLGQKISDRVAEMRTLPQGIDQRSRLPASGLDRARTTSRSRSSELREITDWEKPIYVKVGARAALLRHRRSP